MYIQRQEGLNVPTTGAAIDVTIIGADERLVIPINGGDGGLDVPINGIKRGLVVPINGADGGFYVSVNVAMGNPMSLSPAIMED